MLEGEYEIIVTARDSNYAKAEASFLIFVENDPGRYVFGFFLLFTLLFAIGVMIKDLVIDKLNDNSQENNNEVFIDDEDDIIEQYELEAQFQ